MWGAKVSDGKESSACCRFVSFYRWVIGEHCYSVATQPMFYGVGGTCCLWGRLLLELRG